MSEFNDLKTNCIWDKNCEHISKRGFDDWYKNYKETSDLLTIALERYDSGRMKRYLCELFIQQDLGTLKAIMSKADKLTGDKKQVSVQFKKIVSEIID